MTTAAAFDRPGLTAGQRAAALYKEAQGLAETNVNAFVVNLQALIAQAAEIADGGEIYPTGVRDLCKKLSDQNTFRAQAIISILRHDHTKGVPLQHGSLHEDDLAEEMAAQPVAQPAPVAVAAPARRPAPVLARTLETPAAFPSRGLDPAEVIAAARHAGLGRAGRLPDDL